MRFEGIIPEVQRFAGLSSKEVWFFVKDMMGEKRVQPGGSRWTEEQVGACVFGVCVCVCAVVVDLNLK